MKLIEADGKTVTIQMPRGDLSLLMSCVTGVSHDFNEIEDVHLLGVTQEEISQLWDRMYNLREEHSKVLKDKGIVKMPEDEK